MKHRTPLRTTVLIVTGVAVAAVGGCGLNLEQELADALAAAGRSALDQWLTDLANAAADADQPPANENENDNAPPANENDNDAPANENDNEDPDDPAVRGEAIVADDCAACHGADGASGFATDIQGADAATLADFVAGAEGHIVIQLSETQIAEVEAYLATFVDSGNGNGDGDGNGGGDAAVGESLVADNCAGCHGADGASGFAPDIRNADADLIAAKTGGDGGHLAITLTEQQIADIAAFLAGE